MSVQFEEELMQEVKLSQGECSHPPLCDDVSDKYLSNFYVSDIAEYDGDVHSDQGSPIWPKWAKKTIEAAGNLVGNPLDPRKTIYQFHNAYSACELNIADSFFMMVGYYHQKYQESSLDPR